jgi:hypothetical protein
MPDISEVTSPPSPPFLAPSSSKQEVKEVKEKGGSLETVCDFLRSWFAPLFCRGKKDSYGDIPNRVQSIKTSEKIPSPAEPSSQYSSHLLKDNKQSTS